MAKKTIEIGKRAYWALNLLRLIVPLGMLGVIMLGMKSQIGDRYGLLMIPLLSILMAMPHGVVEGTSQDDASNKSTIAIEVRSWPFYLVIALIVGAAMIAFLMPEFSKFAMPAAFVLLCLHCSIWVFPGMYRGLRNFFRPKPTSDTQAEISGRISARLKDLSE